MIWVTGAGGMIGSHMMDILAERGQDAFGTYYTPTTDITEIDNRAEMSECDVRDADKVASIIARRRPDVIYHLAAQSYPAVSWEKPQLTLDTNAGGTISIFEGIKALRRVDAAYDPMVVVACSSAEYGSSLLELDAPVTEEAALLPLHPYGVSKVAQDLIAYQYFMCDSIRCIRARIFNTTGTRKVGDVCSDYVRRVVAQEKRGAEKIVLRVGNVETYRAIMDCRDTIAALMLLSEKGQPGGVYNISSEHTYRISEVITALEGLLGRPFSLDVDPALLRPTDEHIIVGDNTRLKRDTAWEQAIDLETTLSDMLAYWRGRDDEAIH